MNTTPVDQQIVSADDLINGIKHTAVDHPCCAGTIALAVDRIEVMSHALKSLKSEVNCRIEHGAESGGHLEFVQSKLDEIISKWT
jgi:hypothetical protein